MMPFPYTSLGLKEKDVYHNMRFSKSLDIWKKFVCQLC